MTWDISIDAKNNRFATTGRPGDPKHFIISDLTTGKSIVQPTIDVTKENRGTCGTQTLAFSPDGRRLATVGADHQHILIWDTKTWQQLTLPIRRDGEERSDLQPVELGQAGDEFFRYAVGKVDVVRIATTIGERKNGHGMG